MTHGMFIAAIAVTVIAGVPRVAGAQDAKHGEQVYAAQKCQACHAIGGKGLKANPLDGVGGKLTADDIRAWILRPKEMATKTQSKGKPPMADRYSKLPAADIDALVAYMQSLK
jgi:mono/diheme cytochrome c family protein